MAYNGVCVTEYSDGSGDYVDDCCLVHDSMVVFTFRRDTECDYMVLPRRPFRVDDPDDDVRSVEVVIPKEYT